MTSTETPTSEVLYGAADLIEERGWSSGDGWSNVGNQPLCVEGAIAAAMGVRGGPGFRCVAYDAVRSYVGGAPFIWNDNLLYKNGVAGNGWADARGVKASEVHAQAQAVATLRAAAVIEAAKEQADPAATWSPPVALSPETSGVGA